MFRPLCDHLQATEIYKIKITNAISFLSSYSLVQCKHICVEVRCYEPYNLPDLFCSNILQPRFRPARFVNLHIKEYANWRLRSVILQSEHSRMSTGIFLEFISITKIATGRICELLCATLLVRNARPQGVRRPAGHRQ